MMLVKVINYRYNGRIIRLGDCRHISIVVVSFILIDFVPYS